MAMQAINTARFTWLLLCVIALFTFISQSRYKETRGKRNQVIAWGRVGLLCLLARPIHP